jgi:hypothetical protein
MLHQRLLNIVSDVSKMELQVVVEHEEVEVDEEGQRILVLQDLHTLLLRMQLS